MGRMLTFLARLTKGDTFPGQSTTDVKLYRAVGVDEQTALLLDIKTGVATTVGVGSAYVCSPSHVPESCESDIPLSFSGSFIFVIFCP
jgi:cyanophycinase-like exopeptidase